MKPRNLLLILLTLSAVPLTAQEDNEVGIWTEIGIEKAITKKWDVGLDLEFRAQNRARFSTGISTSYKFNKNLKLGIGYNFLYSQRPDKYKEKSNRDEDPNDYSAGYNLTPEYWFPRHRFNVEATGSIKLWQWLKISLRERYQITYSKERIVTKHKYRQDYATHMNPPDPDPDDPWNWGDLIPVYDCPEGEPREELETEIKPSYTDHVLRSRIKLEFDKKRNPFSPFVSVEFHNSVKPGDDMLLQKIRTAAGMGYKFRKRNEVSFAYLLTFDIYDTEGDEVIRQHNKMHAINVGYKYSF